MKICKECLTEFEPKNNKAIFCSGSCRQKDYRKQIAEKLLKLEGFKGFIPTLLEGKPVVTFPPPAKPFTLENLAEELVAGIDTYHPQPQIRNARLDEKLNDALIEMFQGTMIEIYRKLLDFAKSGASREEVEKRIAQHSKLTPGQKTMIRSQIKA